MSERLPTRLVSRHWSFDAALDRAIAYRKANRSRMERGGHYHVERGRWFWRVLRVYGGAE